MFLDNVVDVVYEIEYGTARRYPGNYTNFIARKKENYDKQMKDHIAQQKEIERLQRMVTRFKGKPTKTSMAQSKQKAIDRMVIIEAQTSTTTRHSMPISSPKRRPETMCFIHQSLQSAMTIRFP